MRDADRLVQPEEGGQQGLGEISSQLDFVRMEPSPKVRLSAAVSLLLITGTDRSGVALPGARLWR